MTTCLFSGGGTAIFRSVYACRMEYYTRVLLVLLLRGVRTCIVGGRVASPLMARPPVHSHVRVQGSSTTVSYSWCSQYVIAVPKQAFASAEKGAVASWQLPVSVLHRQPGDPALAGAGGTKMPEYHV